MHGCWFPSRHLPQMCRSNLVVRINKMKLAFQSYDSSKLIVTSSQNESEHRNRLSSQAENMQDSARSSSKPVRSARRNRERLRVSVSETMVSGSTNTCIMHGRPRLVGTVIRLRVAHPQAPRIAIRCLQPPSVYTPRDTDRDIHEQAVSRSTYTFSVSAKQIHIQSRNVLQALGDNILI